MLVVGAILLVLTGRLFQMQVISTEKYHRIATENRIRVLPVTAPRGIMFDRNGEPLVTNRTSFAISVLPSDFRGTEARAKLASVLDIEDEQLATRLSRRKAMPLEPVGIYYDADFRTICRLQERLDEFPGVLVGNEIAREYPSSGWGGHVIGYVREVSEADQQKARESGKRLRGLIGAVGLEKEYDELLRGVDGVRYSQMNALGQFVGAMPGFEDVVPIPGNDLRLTLDLRLQQLADSLLADYDAGTVVALDVKTGGVLCYVTRPGYDANAFSGVLSTEEWDSLRTDPRHPLLNRGIRGIYSPGSTVKLAVAAMALEKGVVTPATRFGSCTGGYRFGNRIFHCWKPEGHGSLDLAGAVEQSCNVYFYQLIQKLGLDTWSESIAKSGFGAKTGVDLPGEQTGLVPTREYYNKRFGKGRWSRGVTLNLAIGQGEFLVTPMQLAVYYAAIANNGVAMRPHFLLATRSPGSGWTPYHPHQNFKLPYSPSTLAFLRRAAATVVQGEHGTARRFQDQDVELAGKTGTAQNPHGKEHAWFAGFAPASDPQIAIVALVENTGHGSEFAAPICYQIARAFLVPEPPQSELVTTGDDELPVVEPAGPPITQ
ncbi:MAG: penicillin-binding protein 2 [Candidatus Zixiibacteriota bacterium]